MSSSERFGYEWDKYSGIDSNYEKQFKNWIYPLESEFFKDKVILDAGCGMGRNSFWPLQWGAREVVAFDFDRRSVESAKRNLEHFNNVEVFYKSIYDITWVDKFDIAFSIGVIHHLKDPKQALQNMIKALKSDGTLLIWVYSYEGNEWIVKLVDPIRKNITSKLPVGLVHFLSYLCSIPLYIFIKMFKNTNGYLKQISNFKFWHVHSIVFDQLIPDIANYWKKTEVEELFLNLGLKSVDIHQPPNKSGWIIIGKK
ncbi:MAG: class I SAM-dependent methyltransferase [Patescibacteria group bacterium]|jgi:SAM-dependent methyltransferase